jgi:hypothetical protein
MKKDLPYNELFSVYILDINSENHFIENCDEEEAINVTHKVETHLNKFHNKENKLENEKEFNLEINL